jgi:hypothetical protein
VRRFSRALIAAALATLAATTTGCRKKPTLDECDALVRRYAETLVDRERPGLSRGARERLVAQAVSDARGAPAFRRCPDEISAASLACARDAFDPDQVERCLIDVP